jgi:hypothetical protein
MRPIKKFKEICITFSIQVEHVNMHMCGTFFDALKTINFHDIQIIFFHTDDVVENLFTTFESPEIITRHYGKVTGFGGDMVRPLNLQHTWLNIG